MPLFGKLPYHTIIFLSEIPNQKQPLFKLPVVDFEKLKENFKNIFKKTSGILLWLFIFALTYTLAFCVCILSIKNDGSFSFPCIHGVATPNNSFTLNSLLVLNFKFFFYKLFLVVAKIKKILIYSWLISTRSNYFYFVVLPTLVLFGQLKLKVVTIWNERLLKYLEVVALKSVAFIKKKLNLYYFFLNIAGFSNFVVGGVFANTLILSLLRCVVSFSFICKKFWLILFFFMFSVSSLFLFGFFYFFYILLFFFFIRMYFFFYIVIFFFNVVVFFFYRLFLVLSYVFKVLLSVFFNLIRRVLFAVNFFFNQLVSIRYFYVLVVLEKLTNLTYFIFFRFALPLRLVVRFLLLFFAIVRSAITLFFFDTFSFVFSFVKIVRLGIFFYYIKRNFFLCIFIFYIFNLDKLYFLSSFLDFIFEYNTFRESTINFDDFFFLTNTVVGSPLLISSIFLVIIFEVGSLYFNVSVAKRLIFSVYFTLLFIILLFYWFLPEFVVFSLLLLKYNGFLVFFLFTYRSLREDQRFFSGIAVDPFKFFGDYGTFKVPRSVSIVFRFRGGVFNSHMEHFYFFFIFMFLWLFLYDFSIFEITDKFSIFSGLSISFFCKFFILIYLFFRQSTYSYFLWLFSLLYIISWSLIALYLFSISNFSYFGVIFNSNFSETTALSSLGLLSSISGLESLVLPGKINTLPFYFGEHFSSGVGDLGEFLFFDNVQFTNTPFSVFGDMHIQPSIATPHDDHNWVIANTLEKRYFDSTRLQKSASDVVGGDFGGFWMLERNSYNFFGEFVESDLYYGWSNSVLIDTQTYFDYSPYALTNIFGDGLVRNLVTDIFTVFVGPVELDESSLLNLRDWGSSYAPGSTSNRVSGGESSGLENSNLLNPEQRSRENGESHHEWFPGLYVLDGRLDSKFFLFFLRFFIVAVLPIIFIGVLFSLLGKPSNNFDETFGEIEFTNFNFYFFGNEQVETFTTYFWNPTYSVNFEWPTDAYSADPVAYEPTNNLFEDVFKNVQSGLFNFTVLDSFFFLPILKHTEGYSTSSYKDFVMPLIFPSGSDSKTARVVDFSNFYSNLKKITAENYASPESYYDRSTNKSFLKKKKKYSIHAKKFAKIPLRRSKRNTESKAYFKDFLIGIRAKNTTFSGNTLSNKQRRVSKWPSFSNNGGFIFGNEYILNSFDKFQRNHSNFSVSSYGTSSYTSQDFPKLTNATYLFSKNPPLVLLSSSKYDVKNFINRLFLSSQNFKFKKRKNELKKNINLQNANLGAYVPFFEKLPSKPIKLKFKPAVSNNVGTVVRFIKSSSRRRLPFRYNISPKYVAFSKFIFYKNLHVVSLLCLFFYRVGLEERAPLIRVKTTITPTKPSLMFLQAPIKNSADLVRSRMSKFFYFLKIDFFYTFLFTNTVLKNNYSTVGLTLDFFSNKNTGLCKNSKGTFRWSIADIPFFLVKKKKFEYAYLSKVRSDLSITFMGYLHFFKNLLYFGLKSSQSSISNNIQLSFSDNSLKIFKPLATTLIFTKKKTQINFFLYFCNLSTVHSISKLLLVLLKRLLLTVLNKKVVFSYKQHRTPIEVRHSMFRIRSVGFFYLRALFYLRVRPVLGSAQALYQSIGNCFIILRYRLFFFLKVFYKIFTIFLILTISCNKTISLELISHANALPISLVLLNLKNKTRFFVESLSLSVSLSFEKNKNTTLGFSYNTPSTQYRKLYKYSTTFRNYEEGLRFIYKKGYKWSVTGLLFLIKRLRLSFRCILFFFKTSRHFFILFSKKISYVFEKWLRRITRFVNTSLFGVTYPTLSLLRKSKIGVVFFITNGRSVYSYIKKINKNISLLRTFGEIFLNRTVSLEDTRVVSKHEDFLQDLATLYQKKENDYFLEEVEILNFLGYGKIITSKYGSSNFDQFGEEKNIKSLLISFKKESNKYDECSEAAILAKIQLEKEKRIRLEGMVEEYKKTKCLFGTKAEFIAKIPAKRVRFGFPQKRIMAYYNTLTTEQWSGGVSNKVPVKFFFDSNLSSKVGSQNLSVYLPNYKMGQFLANEVAYEINFEYNTLFESLVSEFLSPDGSRHNSLEYEFEDTNPDYSTVTEFADPDKNYAESELFENDTIIDDPRSFEFTEDTDRGWLFRRVKQHNSKSIKFRKLSRDETTDYQNKVMRKMETSQDLGLRPIGLLTNSSSFLRLNTTNFTTLSQNSKVFNKLAGVRKLALDQSIRNKSASWLDSVGGNLSINRRNFVNDGSFQLLKLSNIIGRRVKNLVMSSSIRSKLGKLSNYKAPKVPEVMFSTAIFKNIENRLRFYNRFFYGLSKMVYSDRYNWLQSKSIFYVFSKFLSSSPASSKLRTFSKLGYCLPSVRNSINLKFLKSPMTAIRAGLQLQLSFYLLRKRFSIFFFKSSRVHHYHNYGIYRNFKLNQLLFGELGGRKTFRNTNKVETPGRFGCLTLRQTNAWISSTFNFTVILFFCFNFFNFCKKINKINKLRLSEASGSFLLFRLFFKKYPTILHKKSKKVGYYFYRNIVNYFFLKKSKKHVYIKSIAEGRSLNYYRLARPLGKHRLDKAVPLRNLQASCLRTKYFFRPTVTKYHKVGILSKIFFFANEFKNRQNIDVENFREFFIFLKYSEILFDILNYAQKTSARCQLLPLYVVYGSHFKVLSVFIVISPIVNTDLVYMFYSVLTKIPKSFGKFGISKPNGAVPLKIKNIIAKYSIIPILDVIIVLSTQCEIFSRHTSMLSILNDLTVFIFFFYTSFVSICKIYKNSFSINSGIIRVRRPDAVALRKVHTFVKKYGYFIPYSKRTIILVLEKTFKNKDVLSSFYGPSRDYNNSVSVSKLFLFIVNYVKFTTLVYKIAASSNKKMSKISTMVYLALNCYVFLNKRLFLSLSSYFRKPAFVLFYEKNTKSVKKFYKKIIKKNYFFKPKFNQSNTKKPKIRLKTPTIKKLPKLKDRWDDVERALLFSRWVVVYYFNKKFPNFVKNARALRHSFKSFVGSLGSYDKKFKILNDDFTFFREYGSIWLSEYVKRCSKLMGRNVFDKDINRSDFFLQNIESRRLSSFIGVVSLRLGIRLFLEKKYPKFIHKVSIFLLTNKKNSNFNYVSGYFFFDYTESFVRFFHKKLIFGFLFEKTSEVSKFRFKFDLSAEYSRSEKIKSLLYKTSRIFNPTQLSVHSNFMRIVVRFSKPTLGGRIFKSFKSTSVFSFLKNIYFRGGVRSSYFENMRENLRFLGPSVRAYQYLSMFSKNIKNKVTSFVNSYFFDYNSNNTKNPTAMAPSKYAAKRFTHRVRKFSNILRAIGFVGISDFRWHWPKLISSVSLVTTSFIRFIMDWSSMFLLKSVSTWLSPKTIKYNRGRVGHILNFNFKKEDSEFWFSRNYFKNKRLFAVPGCFNLTFKVSSEITDSSNGVVFFEMALYNILYIKKIWNSLKFNYRGVRLYKKSIFWVTISKKGFYLKKPNKEIFKYSMFFQEFSNYSVTYTPLLLERLFCGGIHSPTKLTNSGRLEQFNFNLASWNLLFSSTVRVITTNFWYFFKRKNSTFPFVFLFKNGATMPSLEYYRRYFVFYFFEKVFLLLSRGALCDSGVGNFFYRSDLFWANKSIQLNKTSAILAVLAYQLVRMRGRVVVMLLFKFLILDLIFLLESWSNLKCFSFNFIFSVIVSRFSFVLSTFSIPSEYVAVLEMLFLFFLSLKSSDNSLVVKSNSNFFFSKLRLLFSIVLGEYFYLNSKFFLYCWANSCRVFKKNKNNTASSFLVFSDSVLIANSTSIRSYTNLGGYFLFYNLTDKAAVGDVFILKEFAVRRFFDYLFLKLVDLLRFTLGNVCMFFNKALLKKYKKVAALAVGANFVTVGQFYFFFEYLGISKIKKNLLIFMGLPLLSVFCHNIGGFVCTTVSKLCRKKNRKAKSKNFKIEMGVKKTEYTFYLYFRKLTPTCFSSKMALVLAPASLMLIYPLLGLFLKVLFYKLLVSDFAIYKSSRCLKVLWVFLGLSLAEFGCVLCIFLSFFFIDFLFYLSNQKTTISFLSIKVLFLIVGSPNYCTNGLLRSLKITSIDNSRIFVEKVKILKFLSQMLSKVCKLTLGKYSTPFRFFTPNIRLNFNCIANLPHTKSTNILAETGNIKKKNGKIYLIKKINFFFRFFKEKASTVSHLSGFLNKRVNDKAWAVKVFRRLIVLPILGDSGSLFQKKIDYLHWFSVCGNTQKLRFGRLSYTIGSLVDFGKQYGTLRSLISYAQNDFIGAHKLKNLIVLSNRLNFRIKNKPFNNLFLDHKIRIKFIPEVGSNGLVAGYNREQTFDFLVDLFFYWFPKKKTINFSLGVCRWLDSVFLKWKEQKIILLMHKVGIRGFGNLSGGNLAISISQDFFIMTDTALPVTVEDLLYFRDYTKLFLHKLIFLVKSEKLTISAIRDKSVEALKYVVNFRFFNRFGWASFRPPSFQRYFGYNYNGPKANYGDFKFTGKINRGGVFKVHSQNNPIVQNISNVLLKTSASADGLDLGLLERESLARVRDQHWTQIERYETWTDSSNTSLTSITSFESKYYWSKSQYSNFLLKSYLKRKVNIRHKKTAINKKVNYLKNTNIWGVSSPLPFKNGVRFTIFEDPFDEFIFHTISTKRVPKFEKNTKDTKWYKMDKKRITSNRSILNSTSSYGLKDDYEFIGHLEVGRMYFKNTKSFVRHPYDIKKTSAVTFLKHNALFPSESVFVKAKKYSIWRPRKYSRRFKTSKQKKKKRRRRAYRKSKIRQSNYNAYNAGFNMNLANQLAPNFIKKSGYSRKIFFKKKSKVRFKRAELIKKPVLRVRTYSDRYRLRMFNNNFGKREVKKLVKLARPPRVVLSKKRSMRFVRAVGRTKRKIKMKKTNFKIDSSNHKKPYSNEIFKSWRLGFKKKKKSFFGLKFVFSLVGLEDDLKILDLFIYFCFCFFKYLSCAFSYSRFGWSLSWFVYFFFLRYGSVFVRHFIIRRGLFKKNLSDRTNSVLSFLDIFLATRHSILSNIEQPLISKNRVFSSKSSTGGVGSMKSNSPTLRFFFVKKKSNSIKKSINQKSNNKFLINSLGTLGEFFNTPPALLKFVKIPVKTKKTIKIIPKNIFLGTLGRYYYSSGVGVLSRLLKKNIFRYKFFYRRPAVLDFKKKSTSSQLVVLNKQVAGGSSIANFFKKNYLKGLHKKRSDLEVNIVERLCSRDSYIFSHLQNKAFYLNKRLLQKDRRSGVVNQIKNAKSVLRKIKEYKLIVRELESEVVKLYLKKKYKSNDILFRYNYFRRSFYMLDINFDKVESTVLDFIYRSRRLLSGSFGVTTRQNAGKNSPHRSNLLRVLSQRTFPKGKKWYSDSSFAKFSAFNDTLPRFEYRSRYFVNGNSGISQSQAFKRMVLSNSVKVLNKLSKGRRESLSSTVKNKKFKKYFRYGGMWHSKSFFKKSGIRRVRFRKFRIRKLPVERLRRPTSNNYLDYEISNRNFMRTDNTSYRTKYLINSPEYRKEKLGLFLKKSKFLNMHDESYDFEFMYKIIPFFFKGIWSGSDSGQTVIDYKKNLVSSSDPDYKTFSPIFGIFILNVNRLARDLLKNNWNYSEGFFCLESFSRKVFVFVSDHDTQFFDDRFVVIQNFLLFWLEFFRYIYIKRWSMTLDYTKNLKQNLENIKHQYPVGFMHELYWYKFLVFTRFVRSRILRNRYIFKIRKELLEPKMDGLFFSYFKLILFKRAVSEALRKNLEITVLADTGVYKFSDMPTRVDVALFANSAKLVSYFKKYLSIEFAKITLTIKLSDSCGYRDESGFIVKKLLENWRNPTLPGYFCKNKELGVVALGYFGQNFTPNGQNIDVFGGAMSLKKKSNNLDLKKSETLYDKLPNFNSVVPGWVSNNVIVFSRSMFQTHAKNTNPMFGFYKPYPNMRMENPFEAAPIVADTETPIKKYLYFLALKPKAYAESDIYSDSETNMYTLNNYEKTKPDQKIQPELNQIRGVFKQDTNPLDNSWRGRKTETFKSLKKNNYTTFRSSARKDTSLRYNRNWFFSNHILSDWLTTLSYSGSWIFLSDFEVDRKRSFSRNNKHGSKYRLNFNTELWWTRTEVPDYNFRRVDAVGYNNISGVLDSDGEYSHLIDGFLDVVNIPEGLEFLDTTTPLFERSLVDPESPALNEDGEFPEFDLNTTYNSEVIKRLNFLPNQFGWSTYSNGSDSVKKAWNPSSNYLHPESFSYFKDIKNKAMVDTNTRESGYRRSFSFKEGNVDWESREVFGLNLKKEIKNLAKFGYSRSLFFGKNNNNFRKQCDLNVVDLPDIIDVLSIRSVHPLANSVENIFSDLIDQKIDEALEYYSITGTSYENLFLSFTTNNLNPSLSWYYLDFFGEHGLSFLENPYGFDYDLVLQKYAPKYWKYVLEVDSSWNSNYTYAFPQIHDPVDNFTEYLPVWNYDPSIWELHGFDFEVSPLVLSDDSKALLGSKSPYQNQQFKWLSSKNLTANSIQISDLGWGGSDIINGLGANLPYDFLYASDDDSDFEMYSEYFFTRNWEDDTTRSKKNNASAYETTTTETEEYPQNGFFKSMYSPNKKLTEKIPSRNIVVEKKRRKKLRSNKNVLNDVSVNRSEYADADPKRADWELKYKGIFDEYLDSETFNKNHYSKYLSASIHDNIYNTKILSKNNDVFSLQHNDYLVSYFRQKKLINKFRMSGASDKNILSGAWMGRSVLRQSLGLREHNDILYQIPIGLENNKSRLLSENFWKLMYVYFVSKFSNNSDSLPESFKSSNRVESDRFIHRDVRVLFLGYDYTTSWNSYLTPATNITQFSKSRFKLILNSSMQFKLAGVDNHLSTNKVLAVVKKAYIPENRLNLAKRSNLNFYFSSVKKKNLSNFRFIRGNVNSPENSNLNQKAKVISRSGVLGDYFKVDGFAGGLVGRNYMFICEKTFTNFFFKIKSSSGHYPKVSLKKNNNSFVSSGRIRFFRKVLPFLFKKYKQKSDVVDKILKFGNFKTDRYLTVLFGNKLISFRGFRESLLTNHYFETGNTKKYFKLSGFNFSTINFNLGTKRGGIGDSSHWSSGTEYLNEHFRRSFSSVGSQYGLDWWGTKNARFPLGGGVESQHTDADYVTSIAEKSRPGESGLYGKLDFSTSEGSEFSANIMSEIGNEIDNYYDDNFIGEQDLDLFSYIDWGFNSDRDNLDSDVNFLVSDPFTADLLRDPTTESVYLDIIQNEYGRELREFPEEIADWTVSDYYSEVLDKGEISDIPNSTNESELYSIDSSNSISDFYLGSDINSELGVETLHISEEMSTDFNDFDMMNGNPGRQKKFELFNDIVKIQQSSANVGPKSNPLVEFFSSPNLGLSGAPVGFQDYKVPQQIDSDVNQRLFGRDWSDSNKTELEENSRELESIFKQQKFVDSFRVESVFDELLIKINISKSLGLTINIGSYLPEVRECAISFKSVLFLKTDYLLQYRGIMVDLGYSEYMF